jgi:hypothetical protein
VQDESAGDLSAAATLTARLILTLLDDRGATLSVGKGEPPRSQRRDMPIAFSDVCFEG